MTRDLLSAVLQRGIETLNRSGLPDPVGEAYHLMGFAIGGDRGAISNRADTALTPDEQLRFFAALDQRQLRVPISQIIGRRAFWKHDFHVTSAVLDPRPDTETLVEEALKVPFTSVLDLGTGSGCIVLSLLAERPNAQGIGCDYSVAALEVAAINAVELEVEPRVQWIESDWFSRVAGQFDLIVSNPPYITAEAFDALQPEVRLHEPKLALTPGGDGLDPYRVIAAQVCEYLMPEGRLMVEIGFDQGEAVRELFLQAGLTDVCVVQDINGKDRVVTAILR